MINPIASTSVSFSGKKLFISGEKQAVVDFPSAIDQIEQFEHVIIVMIDPVIHGFLRERFLNENVYGVSYGGKILWQIEKLSYVYEDSPFTGMGKAGAYVKLCNWDGTDLWVEPETGKIVKKGFSK